MPNMQYMYLRKAVNTDNNTVSRESYSWTQNNPILGHRYLVYSRVNVALSIEIQVYKNKYTKIYRFYMVKAAKKAEHDVHACTGKDLYLFDENVCCLTRMFAVWRECLLFDENVCCLIPVQIPLCLSGLRSIGFLLKYEISNNLGLSSDLITILAKVCSTNPILIFPSNQHLAKICVGHLETCC